MAKQDRYAELADQIVGLMGGKKNISYFTHCVTRLRFNVKDKGLVCKADIEKLPGAMGVQWSGDQLQVIIGQSVADAYSLICEKHGFKQQEGIEEDLGDALDKKKFSLNTVFDAIAGCITPLIPMLVGVGFIKIIVMLCETLGVLTPGMPTHTVLTFVGDAGFYFLPVFIGGVAAKKFGANQGLGMLLGAMLIHPTFIASVQEGAALDIFGLPIYAASYTSSVFPAILACAVMAPIERFVAKISPDVIRSITEPLLTLAVMVPLTLCVLAPLGAMIGTYLSVAIMWLYNTTGFFGVALLSAAYPLIIMTGMHSSLTPYAVQALGTLGKESIVVPAMLISNINQGVASLVVALRSKDESVRSTALSCAITAIVGGVTEPAMYGVTLKYKTPMYAAMIGSFAGALVAGIGGAGSYIVSGAKGLLAIPAYIGPDPSNVMWMVAGIAVGVIATLIAAFLLYRPAADADV